MDYNLTDLIEAWFAEHDDGEFVSDIRAHPYSVIGPASDEGRIIFATKPHIVSAAMYDGQILDEFGMIGRGGLPSQTDLHWISRVIGPREVLFLGDMDPVDLVVFAWLRAGLHPTHVTFVGVNDAFVKAVKISSIKTLWFPCDPSEQQSLPLLKRVLPDLSETVGKNCARMLERGQKLELDGFGSDKKKRVAIAQFVGSQERRGGN
jgi:hypothetical protein